MSDTRSEYGGTTPVSDDGQVFPDEELVQQPGEDVLDVDQLTEALPTTYDITSYGADYPVDGLVKRLKAGDIVVPSFDPAYDGEDVDEFQRRFVWGRPQMDRFIESLLLGLPVPGIFLVRDRTNRLLVLDGQQRLRTLQYFYSGFYRDKRYRLQNVQKPFNGASYEELEPEDRRRLDDSIIHATILRQESPEGSQNAVYSIFERLNTGGSPLQPQEIRVALYPGPFLRGLTQLNDVPAWKDLYGAQSARFKDQELILRILALFEGTVEYARPLKGFLNDYLALNQLRDLSPDSDIGALFAAAMDVIDKAIGVRAFRPVRSLNAAIVDSLSVAMMRRIQAKSTVDTASLVEAYDSLLANESYRDATTSSTAAEDTVKRRIKLATEAFAGVD